MPAARITSGPVGTHQEVRDHLLQVIRGKPWDPSWSTGRTAGGPAGDLSRPLGLVRGGSRNWPPMSWLGEGRGGQGWGALDCWHLASMTPDKYSSCVGLFDTELLSGIYNAWVLGCASLASIPDSRGLCVPAARHSIDLSRKVSAAYVALLALHAVAERPTLVRLRAFEGERTYVPRETEPLPWIISPANRGLPKRTAAAFPTDSNPLGWWLALALDWPGRPGARPRPDGPQWWLWSMLEFAELDYRETWPPQWFGLSIAQRADLRSFIRTDGASGAETLWRLAGRAPLKVDVHVRRWPGHLTSWMPASINDNNVAILSAQWHRGESILCAPAESTPGRGIDRGSCWDSTASRRIVARADGTTVRTNIYPRSGPNAEVTWGPGAVEAAALLRQGSAGQSGVLDFSSQAIPSLI